MLPWRAHAHREELKRAARARPKNMCALARAARARETFRARNARAQQKSARVTPLLFYASVGTKTVLFDFRFLQY